MLDLIEPTNIATGPGSTSGAGCAHDGGPLWISVPIQTECQEPVVARFFQKGKAQKTSSDYHSRHNNLHYAQEKSFGEDDLVECLAVFLCNTEACVDCDTSGGEIRVRGSYTPGHGATNNSVNNADFAVFAPNYDNNTGDSSDICVCDFHRGLVRDDFGNCTCDSSNYMGENT